MGLYVAHVGRVVIKSQFLNDFQALYDGRYEHINDYKIRSLACRFGKKGTTVPIKYWKLESKRPEWAGIYTTSFGNRIFTYGVCYDASGSGREFYKFFFNIILPYVTEVEIICDSWMEE